MTTAPNVFISAGNTVNRESRARVIQKVAPEETPFLSLCARQNIRATLHQWATQTRATGSDGTARHEGADYTVDAVVTPANYTNSMQILTKAVRLAKTAQAIDTAGDNLTMEYQMVEKGIEHKIEIDRALCGTAAQVASGARASRGYIHFAAQTVSGSPIGVHVVNGTGFVAPTSATGAITMQTGGFINTGAAGAAGGEADLLDLLGQLWTRGAKPDHILMSYFVKQGFNSFRGLDRSRVQIRPNEVVNTIDTYKSDVGEHFAIPSRNVNPNVMMAFEKGKQAVGWLRAYETRDVETQGDYDMSAITSEFTYLPLAPEYNGLISGLAGNAGQLPV